MSDDWAKAAEEQEAKDLASKVRRLRLFLFFVKRRRRVLAIKVLSGRFRGKSLDSVFGRNREKCEELKGSAGKYWEMRGIL